MTYYDDRRYLHPGRYARPTGYADQPYASYGSRRHDDSDDSDIEEVRRDFPPGSDYYRYGNARPQTSRVTTVRDSGVRRARSTGGRGPHYGEGYYNCPDDRRRSKRYDDKCGRPDRSPSRSPAPRPRRRKSLSEQALGALGGVLGSSSSKRDQSDSGKHHDRDSSRSRKSHHHHRHSSSSRRRHDKTDEQLAQAVKAALVAGAAEAFRSRKEPGDWTGEKGRRILTAAITAGGTDGLLDRDPDKHSKRHIIESVLAGLATNRVRSKSRGRHRSRSRDSYDSRSPPRHRGSKKRSQSMSESITKGLAAIGLSDGEKKDRRCRHQRSSRYSDDSYDESDSDNGCRHSGRHGRSPSDGYSREVGGLLTPADSTTTSSLIPSEAYGFGVYGSNGDGGRRADSDTDSDLGSSSDEKHTRKKMHRKELLTAGLATVATIHAAHNVVESIEKRKKRRELLEEGEITPEEARKRRMKANLADAASIGLAALGIKGAVAEWKEANAKREESKAYKKECQERAEKRAARRARSQSDAYPRSQRYLEEYE